MIKKIVCIVLSIIVLIGAGIGIYRCYEDTHAVLVIYDLILKKDNFIYLPSCGYGKCSEKFMERANTINSDTQKFQEEFFETYEEPYQVEVNFESHIGKTTIKYYGTAKNKTTGEIEEINKIFTYKFLTTYEEPGQVEFLDHRPLPTLAQNYKSSVG